MTGFSLIVGSSLPTGWDYTLAGDFRRKRSITFNPAVATDEKYELWSVPSHAYDAPEIVTAGDIGSSKQFVSPGDVLISKINPHLNRTWIVRESRGLAQIASTEWIVFPRSDGIDSRFLATLLSDNRIRDFLSTNASGVGGSLMRARPTLFDKMRIPFPPLNEQRRIVEKIETMFDEIDKGVESLRAAKSTLDLYRKSLLKAAFEGRLTADWRARNPDKLESPDDLLARIRQEREGRYQAASKDWREAVSLWRASGQKGKKPAKPKRLLPLADMADCPKRAATPPEWIWLRLAGLGTVNGGLTKNQGRNSLPLMATYLRVANVYTNRLELDEIKQIGVTQDELRRTRLVPGDLLFVEGNGSIDQIGRVALWDGSIPDMTHQNHLIRFSTDGFLLQRFALLFCMSPEGRELITAQASSTSGLHTLSISKVEALPVPICAPDEQAEVVRLLDLELDAADTLEAEIGAGLARAEALRQSILKEAFAGRLVPQDPQDEPASDLLARIGTAHRSDHKETRQQAANA